MKNIRKIMILLLAAAMLLSLSACFKEEENVPDNKSETSGLYTSTDAEGNAVVVNPYNVAASNFSVDGDGNILNAKGEIFISAANALAYVPVTGISAVCTETFPLDLPVSGSGEAQPKSVDIQVTLSPADATCRAIMVESDNSDVAEVAVAGYNVAPGSDSVTVKVTLKSAGTANIRIKSSAAEGEALAATVAVSATAAGSTLPGDPTTTTEPNTDPTTEPSPSPAVTPAPTPTPAVNLGTGRVAYIVAESGLNLREGASTGSNIVTTIPYGEQVTVYGDAQNGWYYASANGRTGYISASYVSFTMPTATPAPTSTPEPTPDPYGGENGSSEDPDDGGDEGGVTVIQ